MKLYSLLFILISLTTLKAQFATNGGSSGDLILSFYQAGYDSNIEVDLGQASNYAGTNVDIGNIGTALASQYGSNWFTSSTLSFNILGTVTSSRTVYASNTSSTPYAVVGGAVLVSRSTILQRVYSPQTSTPSPTSLFIVNPVTGVSAALVPNANTASATTFTTLTSNYPNSSVSFGSGNTVSTYLNTQVPGRSSVSNGRFKIDSTGELTYDAPEPSTANLIGLGVIILVLVRLSRRVNLNRIGLGK